MCAMLAHSGISSATCLEVFTRIRLKYDTGYQWLAVAVTLWGLAGWTSVDEDIVLVVMGVGMVVVVVGYTAMEVMRVRRGGRGDGKGRKPFLHCANDWPHSIKR